jgi:peroxiredoxin Q/BCP
LISDADGSICEAYGVWIQKSFLGKRYMGIDRATFLINPHGKIEKIWRSVKVDGHVEEVLESLPSS